MQMAFAHAVICAGDAAFQDRKEVFRRVGMGVAAEARIFVRGMTDRVVIGELGAERRVDRAFVGHQNAGAAGVGHDQRANAFRGHIGDV